MLENCPEDWKSGRLPTSDATKEKMREHSAKKNMTPEQKAILSEQVKLRNANMREE